MRSFRYTVIFAILSFTFASASAQSVGHLSGGEDELARHAIANFKSTPVVRGFRICLYNGSDQDARSHAQGTLGLLQSVYPSIHGHLVYDAPIFKVITGACVSRIEATQLLAKLRPSFPNAFIISSEIPISDFIVGKELVTDSLQVEALPF